MQIYLDLLQNILDKGTWKPAARENLPKTKSLFGYQYRHNLNDGFPILTTKQVSFKNIKTELIWFLRGGGNIKFLVDNGCNIWNQDAYRYYLKQPIQELIYSFEDFIKQIKIGYLPDFGKYTVGNCPLGYELWRNFDGEDQIKNLIQSLTSTPQKRNHLLTAYNPAYKDVALDPCHILAQFNCRPIDKNMRLNIALNSFYGEDNDECLLNSRLNELEENDAVDWFIEQNSPSYILDCHLYQRSCDFFLGVPYNTASYALLTHIFAEITGMIPGELIHTFGDVHIYENHMDSILEQLRRIPTELPKLVINNSFKDHITQWSIGDVWNDKEFISTIQPDWFILNDYNPQPPIKAELKTGLK